MTANIEIIETEIPGITTTTTVTVGLGAVMGTDDHDNIKATGVQDEDTENAITRRIFPCLFESNARSP